MKSFLIRLASSVTLTAIMFVLLHFGGVPLALMLAVICLTGLFEYDRALGLWGTLPAWVVFGGAVLVLAAVFLLPEAVLPALILSLLVLLGVYVFSFPRHDIGRIAESFFGLVYVPLMLSYLWRIREMEEGQVLVWIVLLVSWGSDVMAYCTGILLGRHKLTSELSPKKTVEGAVGAVVGTALLGVLFALLFREKLSAFGNPFLSMALIGALGSVISQIGDLAASAVKRNRGIKDYGNLIPGHGGILDRFDSVVISAPIIYYLIVFLTDGGVS